MTKGKQSDNQKGSSCSYSYHSLFISFKVSLPFSDNVNTFIKVGTVAGLIYILATFRGDE